MIGRWFFQAALALAVAGCSADAGDGSISGAERGDGSNGAAPDETGAESIRFLEDAIVFVPGDDTPREISVEVSPPAEYSVRFTLLGDPQDAFLDQSEVWSDPEGRATAVLTAPSTPSTFTLRASVGGSVSAELPASAADIIGKVRVLPQYAGTRLVTTWVASVTTGRRCSELEGIPPPDGSLVAEAPESESPTVDYVPIGTPVAVTVRAGHFAGGCADTVALLPEPLLNDVTIRVLDRPLQLGETDMPLSLSANSSLEWRWALDSVAAEVTAAFVGDSLTDMHALLDAMQRETPTLTSANAFGVARTNGSWEFVLKDALGFTRAEQGLRTLIRTWMTRGLEGLPDQPLLEAQLKAGTEPTVATLELHSIAGSSPTQMGFPSSAVAAWTADSDDTVRMGTNLEWTPSLLLTGLAYEPALAEVSGATDVPQALAETYSCTDVANALTQSVEFAFGTCDASCMTNLCERALRTMWTQAARASVETSQMEIAAAGPSDPIDDDARPLGFAGPWVGTAALPGGMEVRFEGEATGGLSNTSSLPK